MAQGKGLEGEWRGKKERPLSWMEFGEKKVAKETERTGIPMQSIPRHSKRARVIASRESKRLKIFMGLKKKFKEATSKQEIGNT